MAGKFQLRNPDTGKILIDTEYARLGLVKSGTMTPATANGLTEDYTFTVHNAVCPIVYIVGAAVLSYSTRSGNNWTFRYRGWPNLPVYTDRPEPPIPGRTTDNMPHPKFYVFDLMRPNKSGRGLWVRNPNTLETVFNSEQNPLNVRAAVLPPPPATGGGWPRSFYSPGSPWLRPYHGGWDSVAGNTDEVAIHVSNLGLDGSRTWAFFSPWRRGAQFSGTEDYTVLETVGALDGYVGWGWTLDPQTTFGAEPGWGQGAWGANPNRPLITLMDVTDLPFPFEF